MLIYGRLIERYSGTKTVDDDWADSVDKEMCSGKVELDAMFVASAAIFDLSGLMNLRTRNPMLLNTIPGKDSELIEGVWFFGKGNKLICAAECPSIVKKLTMMGLGEALCDTDLENYDGV